MSEKDTVKDSKGKVLVTGGHGFVGAYLVDRLLSDGYEVYVIDDHSSSTDTNITTNAKANNFEVNICDFEAIDKFFQENQDFDYVFHLAADSKFVNCAMNAVKAQVINSIGTVNMLQYSNIIGVRKFILCSTGGVYGVTNQPPFDEDMPVDNSNPLAVSKSTAESLCEMFYRFYNLPTVSLRLFNVFGDGAKDDGFKAPVVAALLKQHKEGLKFTIHGDGAQSRDFVHVEDVVQAIMLAVESENDQILGEVFNVGSGKSYSVMEVVEMIAGKGKKKYNFLPTRAGEPAKSTANINKIKKMLNWKPVKTLKEYINSKK